MLKQDSSVDILDMAADIVAAYITHNSVRGSELPGLIGDVHSALVRMVQNPGVSVVEPPKPAVSARKSVTNDYIICLEDGKKFKSLKRHIRTQYDMSPEAYREKWGLPAEYPMVAPAYAKARSQLAKEMGLGQQRRRR